MRRTLLTLWAVIMLAGLTGCRCGPCRLLPGCFHGCATDGAACDSSCAAGCEMCGGAGCQACPGARVAACGGCGLLGCGGRCGRGQAAFTPGPASAAVTYPYYTNRGPRDFLAKSPPSIGP